MAINDKATADQFKKSVKNYWEKEFFSIINVDLEQFDTLGALTTIADEVVENVYTITVVRLQPQDTVIALQAAKISTAATITFELPDVVQKSLPPLSGYMFVRCMKADNTFTDTREFKYNEWEVNIERYINDDCYEMNDKTLVKVI